MNRSDTIGELAAALAKAQGQMTSASKASQNPFFHSRYANLASIVDAIKVPLANNGLAYVQTTDTEDGAVIVETTLLHASGEWVSGQLRMRPVKDNPQEIGSCLTYARRYALQAIVGLAADEDDDGNAASGNTATPVQKAPQAQTPHPVLPRTAQSVPAPTPAASPLRAQSAQKPPAQPAAKPDELKPTDLAAPMRVELTPAEGAELEDCLGMGVSVYCWACGSEIVETVSNGKRYKEGVIIDTGMKKRHVPLCFDHGGMPDAGLLKIRAERLAAKARAIGAM